MSSDEVKVSGSGTPVTLKVVAGDGSAVRRFHLGLGEHLVGADPGATVALDDARVSRRHALLEVVDDGGVVLTDLHSRHGTFVHGLRIGRTAWRGAAVLAFGPVHAMLTPADPAAGEVLFAPSVGATPAGLRRWERGAARGEAWRAGSGSPTSDGLDAGGRLAETLRQLLPPLLAGEATAAATGEALAARLFTLLPVGRVELLRVSPNGAEALVAAQSTAGRLPRTLATHAIDGPAGWRLSLRTADVEQVRPVEPLLALALELLALAGRTCHAGPRAGSTGAASPRRAVACTDLPPPGGLGPDMARIYRRAGKVARGDVPVLVLGESGSGKEVLARWIHARSARADGPFVPVNCTALPRELLEAELFGIERGVATGVEARVGILERARGGTVFLDEIGDMAPELQAKLLRVLESTSVCRLGGRNPVALDVRFLAATNRDLATLVEQGSFRRDLFHRLAALEATLPPLRRRREEIPALAAQFFRRETEKHGVASAGITRAALGALVGYAWPGNVRELENEIAKAVLLLEGGEPLDLPHLSARVLGAQAGQADPFGLEAAVRRAEREAFALARAAAEDDPVRAMGLLGVSRTTFYRKLKELGAGG